MLTSCLLPWNMWQNKSHDALLITCHPPFSFLFRLHFLDKNLKYNSWGSGSWPSYPEGFWWSLLVPQQARSHNNKEEVNWACLREQQASRFTACLRSGLALLHSPHPGLRRPACQKPPNASSPALHHFTCYTSNFRDPPLPIADRFEKEDMSLDSWTLSDPLWGKARPTNFSTHKDKSLLVAGMTEACFVTPF